MHGGGDCAILKPRSARRCGKINPCLILGRHDFDSVAQQPGSHPEAASIGLDSAGVERLDRADLFRAVLVSLVACAVVVMPWHHAMQIVR